KRHAGARNSETARRHRFSEFNIAQRFRPEKALGYNRFQSQLAELLGHAGRKSRRGTTAEGDEDGIVQRGSRNDVAGDHVLRSEKEFAGRVSCIWKKPCDAAVNGDVAMALRETEIMDADVS